MNQSEESVRQDKQAAMGAELGELHFLLWKDLTWLHSEWQEYRELFGTNAERVALMNRAAPRFFWSLERVLWQDTLLGISRLCDPSGTAGQRNVTMRRLPRLVVPELRTILEEELNEFESKAAFAREWRHKRYAHREERHAAAPETHQLPFASRQRVSDALAAASKVMNRVELHYHNMTTGYEHAGGAGGGGAYSLLRVLDAGLLLDEQRKSRGEGPARPRFV